MHNQNQILITNLNNLIMVRHVSRCKSFGFTANTEILKFLASINQPKNLIPGGEKRTIECVDTIRLKSRDIDFKTASVSYDTSATDVQELCYIQNNTCLRWHICTRCSNLDVTSNTTCPEWHICNRCSIFKIYFQNTTCFKGHTCDRHLNVKSRGITEMSDQFKRFTAQNFAYTKSSLKE